MLCTKINDTGLPTVTIENSRHHLTKGQEKLLALILDKYKKSEKILIEEVQPIYQIAMTRKRNQGWFRDSEGKTHEWDNEYTPAYLTDKATQWLLRNLGSLIKKEYLTVIPRIQLNKENPNKLTQTTRKESL